MARLSAALLPVHTVAATTKHYGLGKDVVALSTPLCAFSADVQWALPYMAPALPGQRWQLAFNNRNPPQGAQQAAQRFQFCMLRCS